MFYERSGSRVTQVSMKVVYLKFVTFCLLPMTDRFTGCTHTSSGCRHWILNIVDPDVP